MYDDASHFRLRDVAVAAFLPTMLFAVGEGAVLPMVPLIAVSLGADLAMAGTIGAMALVGRLLGNIPSGWIVHRFGERATMLGASAVAAAGVVISLVAPTPGVLAFGVLLTGTATGVFALARHSFLTVAVPHHMRGRALSTLGGVFRFGMLVGPFIAALTITLTHDPRSALWIMVACSVLTAVVLILLPDPASVFKVRNTSDAGTDVTLPTPAVAGLFRTIVRQRSMLVRLGAGAAIIAAMRAARVVIIPLWGLSAGVSESQIALIIGIAGIFDFAFFYPGGQIVDRFGRIWGALPSVIGLSVGFIALPVSDAFSDGNAWFLWTAIVLGIANGLGSGLLLTLGSDLAPARVPAPFLGAWRFVSDTGGAVAPLAVAAITAAFSLAVACAVMGTIGLLGAFLLGRYIPRFLP